MRSSLKARGRESPIRASQGTKSPAPLMLLGATHCSGVWASVLVWVGTEVMMAPAASAGVETFETAKIRRSRASVTTAGIRSTWWLQPKPWFRFRTLLAMSRRHRCSCAGITTFNALRHAGALPGELVAIQGIGGLGHLGIQFANKFGYRVAAVGRSTENESLAKKLGADVYIDSKARNAAEELQKLGGARVILATAPSSKAMSELIGGLGPNGKLLVIGAAFDPIEVAPVQLIVGSKTINGWAAGTPADSEDTLRFAELRGVRAMIETYPLEIAAEAYARMMSGKAQFRVVLTI